MKISTPEQTRLKASVRGAVQGVGFRPFVFRLASELGLTGWVNNTTQGVFLEVEGAKAELEHFLARLEQEKPPRSSIQSLEYSWLDPAGYSGFEIRESESGGIRTALVLPDIATCPECLREIFDPKNRRFGYPFTNCTHCGPRFSIIESLPYDRARTSMKKFAMCPQCLAEYNDPRDRRFHAQPNACPVCGPGLELWNAAGEALQGGRDALMAAAQALRRGRIVAVKGLGGFHLMVAAHDAGAVQRLRQRKHREEKPFALMFPSLDAVKSVCEVSALEERLLCSPEAPIVLLHRISGQPSPAAGRPSPPAESQSPEADRRSPLASKPQPISDAVAPGNPNLGVVLPYTPLHHLLMAMLGFPVVATSGNLSDEPICIDETEARERLGNIADLFLVHDRPIVRHVDDSIVRIVADRELVLRRARGFAPLPVMLRMADCGLRNDETVLAVGAHLKNAVALSIGPQVFLSQHIGDLDTDAAYGAFKRVIEDFQKLYEATPRTIAADAHPDYLSTRFAQELANTPSALPPRLVHVQHHAAHVLACMAENELKPPVLGVSWDGTGYGLDGTVWGGEWFRVENWECRRIGHFRRFRLPGGEAAVKEPRRPALALLWEVFGAAALAMEDLPPVRSLTGPERATLGGMLKQGLNSPRTSSAGRLFDAVGSLCGLRQKTRFEGQTAMELEFALEGVETDEAYEFGLGKDSESEGLIVDWAPVVESLVEDVRAGIAAGILSARFHNGLVEAILSVAKRAGLERVVLSGGCFQNRYLTERSVRRLREDGFRPYWHQRVPPNDGGIALGQVVGALGATR